MASVNPLSRELVFKIVYYGPGLGGKTTTLEHIHATAKPDHRGKLVSLATPVDRTLYFDFLPMRLPPIRGMHVRLQLFTVPGQVYFNATRKLVLTGADGVVFVADSQTARADANLESLDNLRDNLADQGRNLNDVPIVFQYNKYDLPDVLSVEELDKLLNRWKAPSIATSARTGLGVYEGLERITHAVLASFETQMPESVRVAAAASFDPNEEGLAAALRGASQGEERPPTSGAIFNRVASSRVTLGSIPPETSTEEAPPVDKVAMRAAGLSVTTFPEVSDDGWTSKDKLAIAPASDASILPKTDSVRGHSMRNSESRSGEAPRSRNRPSVLPPKPFAPLIPQAGPPRAPAGHAPAAPPNATTATAKDHATSHAPAPPPNATTATSHGPAAPPNATITAKKDTTVASFSHAPAPPANATLTAAAKSPAIIDKAPSTEKTIAVPAKAPVVAQAKPEVVPVKPEPVAAKVEVIAPKPEPAPQKIEVVAPKPEPAPQKIEVIAPKPEPAPPKIEVVAPKPEPAPPKVEVIAPKPEPAPQKIEVVAPKPEPAPQKIEVVAPKPEPAPQKIEVVAPRPEPAPQKVEVIAPKPEPAPQKVEVTTSTQPPPSSSLEALVKKSQPPPSSLEALGAKSQPPPSSLEALARKSQPPPAIVEVAPAKPAQDKPTASSEKNAAGFERLDPTQLLSIADLLEPPPEDAGQPPKDAKSSTRIPLVDIGALSDVVGPRSTSPGSKPASSEPEPSPRIMSTRQSSPPSDKPSDSAPAISDSIPVPPPPPPPRPLGALHALIESKPAEATAPITSTSKELSDTNRTPSVAAPADKTDARKPTGLSFADLWPEADRALVHDVETAIASGRCSDAIDLADALVSRVLTSTATLFGSTDATRDATNMPHLLGIDGRRYLAFRSLVRASRSGAKASAQDALSAYAFAIEARMARSSVR